MHLLSTAHYDHSCLEFPNILFSEKMLTLGRVVITVTLNFGLSRVYHFFFGGNDLCLEFNMCVLYFCCFTCCLVLFKSNFCFLIFQLKVLPAQMMQLEKMIKLLF